MLWLLICCAVPSGAEPHINTVRNTDCFCCCAGSQALSDHSDGVQRSANKRFCSPAAADVYNISAMVFVFSTQSMSRML